MNGGRARCPEACQDTRIHISGVLGAARTEDPGCLARIKEVHNVNAKVALQPLDVAVSAVQHLDPARAHHSRGVRRGPRRVLHIPPPRTLVMRGLAKTGASSGMCDRRTSVSTRKSSLRVLTCMRQTKPWNER